MVAGHSLCTPWTRFVVGTVTNNYWRALLICYLLRPTLLLSFATLRKSSLLTPIVRTRFQFVVLTDVTVEEQYLLSVFTHGLFHTDFAIWRPASSFMD